VYVTASVEGNVALFEAYLKQKGGMISKVHYNRDTDTTIGLDQTLDLLCKYCPNVTHLTCACNFTNPAFFTAATHWPRLSSLSTGNLRCESMKMITQGFAKLAQIDVNCSSPSFEGWEEFLTARGPTLTHFTAAAMIDARVYQAIAAHCPQLRVLQNNWAFVSDEVILKIAQNCPLLESVDLRSNPRMPASVIRAFAGHGHLRALYISACQASHEAVAEAIQCSPHLRKLTLCMADMDSCLTAIAAYASLEDLELTWNVPKREAAVLNAKLVAIAQGCPNLRRLRLADLALLGGPCTITDATIAQFATHCPRLTVVCLEGLRVLTDASVSALALGCRWLQTLQVTSAAVTVEGIRAVAAHCCHIREVQLRNQALLQQVQALQVFPKRVLVSKCN
jgi:hypothetical protein